jgi:3,4-dihydroxy 2-butanone 4-phosphate synthase/GTP cyclohydrolase II
VTTGISAHDRARTIQVAVARNAKPDDIVMPGHIFPLTAQKGGVLIRAGHTEAGCDLAHLAGLEPAAVICEILKDDGTMARLPDLITFAQEHGLKIGAIRDLIAWRAATEALVREVSRREVSGAYGRFMLHGFEDTTTGEIHLAMVKGDIDPDAETLVRVHEPISVLDFLDGDSPRHSFSIDRSMQIINDAGCGVIVMLRRTETDADLRRLLDDPGAAPAARWDARTFGVGAQILRALNVRKMRLLANPRKIPSMAGFDLELAGYLTD